jgi:hypothetical protein
VNSWTPSNMPFGANKDSSQETCRGWTHDSVFRGQKAFMRELPIDFSVPLSQHL